ncbi:MAG: SMC-Scp complex subunit ScpB [Candidatus Pelagadaptatus aseana]|uniref:SMC-Scp complex subunit ScpB n=1 Tax=Candidatus Pelagadaptatus aseana TaxID=3120508 RepID=UPI0039B2686C
MSFDQSLLRRIVEGALLAAGEPLSRDKLLSLFPEDEAQPEKDELMAVLEEIQADCKGRGFELKQVASGWRFQVVEDVAPWVNRLWEERPQKYSRAMLETLALIAYRQPITRGDIEEIRGVAVSSHIIKTLSERDWIKVVGHRDVPGRPSLYATTRQFLDYFNLKSLEELPSLNELADIEKLNEELDFETDQKLQAEGGSTEPAEQPETNGVVVEATESAEVQDSESELETDEDGSQSVSLAQALAEEQASDPIEDDGADDGRPETDIPSEEDAVSEEPVVADVDGPDSDESETNSSNKDWSNHGNSLFDS